MPVVPSAARNTSILVVDDRAENLRALVAVLEPLGCRLVTATSGREALRMLLDEQFAVILLDVQMPEMDGFETASYIRDRHRTRTIPIIFLSAVSTSSEHVFRGYETGAVDYIVKPIDPIVIRSKVRVFVELYQRGEEIRRQADILRQRDREHERLETEKRRHRRMSLLNALSVALEKRTDVRGRIEQLARSCVPTFADFALAEVLPGESCDMAAALACANQADQRTLYELLRLYDGTGPTRAEVVSERGYADPSVSRAAWLEVLPGRFGESAWERLAPTSLIVVPLLLQGRGLGRLTLARSNAGEPYGNEEFEIARELAKRASMALETSRLYELERDRSRTLQLSLLGESPLAHPTITAASRYTPGSSDLEVGGDWCDLIERDDGRIFAIVGDVVGRGIRAATAMGKLRSAIGALALVTDDAAALLERLDQFATRIPEAELATVICALIDPEHGTVAYSSAGHLPGLVVLPDGKASSLDGGRGYPLGIDVSAPREQGYARLVTGATLLLFTDGLVEAPDFSIEAGLERLRQAASARATHQPEQLCDELVEELIKRPSDDAALICLRLAPHPEEFEAWHFPASRRQIAPARHRLETWLRDNSVPDEVCADLVLAFGEACTNAVRHAYSNGEGNVIVHLRSNDGELTIRVRDTGRWTERQRSSEGGLGLDIIRALVDDVYVHGTPYGTTLIMRRRLFASGDRPGDGLDAAGGPLRAPAQRALTDRCSDRPVSSG